MRPLLFAAAALAIALPAAPAPAHAQSIAGEWDAAMQTPGGVRTFKILFQVDGEKLTGTVKRPSGDVPLDGTVVGDTVRFSYTIDYNGNPLLLTVTARVAGDSLQGIIDFNGAAQEEFTAKRAAPASPPPSSAPPDRRRSVGA